MSGSLVPFSLHAVDIELGRADHEIDVDDAAIAAGASERVFVHRFRPASVNL